jgi:MFS family permease
MLHALENWTDLMVVRFILGVAEAGISPGFSLLTSLWCRPSEQPLRHGIWFCGNSIASVFASLMSHVLYRIPSHIASCKLPSLFSDESV